MNLTQRTARTALAMMLSAAVAVVAVSCGTSEPSRELAKVLGPVPPASSPPVQMTNSSVSLRLSPPGFADRASGAAMSQDQMSQDQHELAMYGSAWSIPATETMYIGREAIAGKATRRRSGG
ncbi:MAG: hypothetical protein GY894_04320, partial [Planctomycetes bacterium]|nr:hypothetical protein [Planctomycetota bacterium]